MLLSLLFFIFDLLLLLLWCAFTIILVFLPLVCFYYYFGVFTFGVLLLLLRYAFTFGVLNGVGNSSSLSPRETLDTVEVWISFNNFKICFVSVDDD